MVYMQGIQLSTSLLMLVEIPAAYAQLLMYRSQMTETHIFGYVAQTNLPALMMEPTFTRTKMVTSLGYILCKNSWWFHVTIN